MVSTRFLAMIASCLALLVVSVLYFISSKTEYKESNMLEMPSKNEDIGHRSMEFTPDPCQRLTNSKL